MADILRHGDVERAFTEFEIRESKDGSFKIGGYASTFNDPYEVHDRFGTFTETILPGAWDRSLQNKGHKIQLLQSHGGLPYAQSRNGTLRLGTDSHGLSFEADLDVREDPEAKSLAAKIARKNVDEMSVGMRIPASGDSWSDDMTERHISEANLLEISVVSRGANPNTEAAAREAELLEEIRELRSLISSQDDIIDLATEAITLDADIDSLRALLIQREARLPITQELAQLLQRRK